MKRGTEYAKRVKRLFNQWVRKHGRPELSAPIDPIEQLLIAILSVCTSNARGMAAARRVRQQMVDLNELRVTPPMELAELVRDVVPLAREKAERIVSVLNAIRRLQDSLDLSFLHQRGRREAREYLESLDGVDKTIAANVVLHSLGGHAIPVDDLTLYVLRKENLVDPAADAAEVQGFLERNVAAADARVFVELLDRYVAGKAARVPVERLGELLNPPGLQPPAPPPPPPAKDAPAPPAAAPRSEPDRPAKKTDKPGRAKTSRPPKPPAGKPNRSSPRTPKASVRRRAART